MGALVEIVIVGAVEIILVLGAYQFNISGGEGNAYLVSAAAEYDISAFNRHGVCFRAVKCRHYDIAGGLAAMDIRGGIPGKSEGDVTGGHVHIAVAGKLLKSDLQVAGGYADISGAGQR